MRASFAMRRINHQDGFPEDLRRVSNGEKVDGVVGWRSGTGGRWHRDGPGILRGCLGRVSFGWMCGSNSQVCPLPRKLLLKC